MSELCSLRAVTFNAWALPISIPSQRKRRRLSRLPAALTALDADVIVLQEMFDVHARHHLLRQLSPPYNSTADARQARRILGLLPADVTGGLLLLSKFPISGGRFIPHPADVGSKPDERLGRKGAMMAHVETPIGRVTVFAVHLYAGTRPKDSMARMAQLAPLLEALDEEADGGPVILAGDINTSPTVNYPEPPGPANPLAPEYAALVGSGFVDPLPPNPTPVNRSATWVPSRNRYAALPYQETKTDERYDYLMVRPGAAHQWIVREARTVIDAPEAHLSDHVGVLVELALLARVANASGLCGAE